jgi:hypothetical protein
MNSRSVSTNHPAIQADLKALCQIGLFMFDVPKIVAWRRVEQNLRYEIFYFQLSWFSM